MGDRHDKSSFRPIAAAALIAILSYAGMYFWMVQTVFLIPSPSSVMAPRGAAPLPPTAVALYQWGPRGELVQDQELCSKVFAPVYAIDRKLRPATWNMR